MMMEGPSKGVTDKSFKPLCGAVIRKEIVLSDKEKAELISSGGTQGAERK
jgi:hypothetical protein